MDLLLDADATVAMRGLSLLSRILESDAAVSFTGYIYEHELRKPEYLEAHNASNRISVHHVLVRTPADASRRTLIRDERLDKGEAEAIAWLLDDPARAERFVFVTLDVRARKLALKRRLCAMNVAELAAGLVVAELLDVEVVRTHLSVWDDARNQSGRPKKWQDFDTDFTHLLGDVRDRWADRLG